LSGVIEALLAMARTTEAVRWRRFAADTLGTVALGRHIDVDLSGLGAAPALHGDPDLLSVAVANLVDNAARHGATRVRLGAAVDGATQRIEVADDGPGVPPQRLAELRAALARFDRDGELDAALGLGLTLAATVARAHGGRLDLDCEPPPKRGFCARLSWPLAPAP
jgi:signal transduction histidine kinase